MKQARARRVILSSEAGSFLPSPWRSPCNAAKVRRRAFPQISGILVAREIVHIYVFICRLFFVPAIIICRSHLLFAHVAQALFSLVKLRLFLFFSWNAHFNYSNNSPGISCSFFLSVYKIHQQLSNDNFHYTTINILLIFKCNVYNQ